jgi:hypothetical protein
VEETVVERKADDGVLHDHTITEYFVGLSAQRGNSVETPTVALSRPWKFIALAETPYNQTVGNISTLIFLSR